MKDFFKKNIVLVVILSISLLFFFVLAFLAYQEWSKVKKYQASLIELQANITKLNLERPYPVPENLVNIKNDTILLSEKLIEINCLFGNPYEKALNEFLRVLCEDDKASAKFCADWRDYFKKTYKRNESPEKILYSFLDETYPQEQDKIKKAMSAFMEVLRTRTVEPIDESNINEILLDALSVPRTSSPDACKVYIQNIEGALFKFAESANFGNAILVDSESKIFKVYDQENLPPVDSIPQIIKHYKLIEDFLYRMKASGIESITVLNKLNGLEGARDGQYLIFSYQAELIGSSDSIRKLIENLQKAYEDNRMYIIKSLSFNKLLDEIKNQQEEPVASHANPTRKDVRPEQNSASNLKVANMILGLSDKLKVEIRFDYIIYVGDELKTR